jgi:Xaa-Pro dipeptidase
VIDQARLRAGRRQRLWQAMDAAGLDALVLGRPANVRYASGANQLWVAGARPFAPGCVALPATDEVHLMSVWDEGVPAEIDHHHLYGTSWDPPRLVESLAAIPGLAGASRVGTDGMTPLMAELLPTACPQATIVDGGPALRWARSAKTADELACIEAAVAVAGGALAAMAGALRPGVTGRELVAVMAEHVTATGQAIVASEDAVPIGPGPVTGLTPAVLHHGY